MPNVGAEQFRDAITTFRNLHIVAGIDPLIQMRCDLIANDEFLNRGGSDDSTQKHMLQHLLACDKTRRNVTYNPEGVDLGTQMAKAIDPTQTITDPQPFGGDDIQMQSGGLLELAYKLDGTDPDIPLLSQLKPTFIKSKGYLLLGAMDRAIVGWTRMNSRDRTRHITIEDSFRMYGNYQEMYSYITNYLGSKNRTDVVQVLPSQEPRGPAASPNLIGETGPLTPATP